MPVLKKYKPQSEKELHGIIEKELDALEEGLELLRYEMGFTKGIPDFVCVDSGGRLLIIEVKLHEDENILFQALRYFNEIDRDRYIIAQMFPDKKINPEEHPRIILIAGKFSDYIRRLTTLVIPDVELYVYNVLFTPEKHQGICYHSVSVPKIEEMPSKPLEIQDHIDYMTKEELKPIFKNAMKIIMDIGKDIESYSRQDYVGFKYKGRQIGFLYPTRKAFDVGAVIIDDVGRVLDYESIRIESSTQDYTEIFKKIRKTYEILREK